MLRPRLALLASLAALAATALPTGAQAHPAHRPAPRHVAVDRGPVWFEVRPSLVLVTPGLQVVAGLDGEVFVHAGWWWTRHDGHWYRARQWSDRWAPVATRAVPRSLRRIPVNTYRDYRPRVARHRRPAPQRVYYGPAARPASDRDHARHLRQARKLERKAERQQAKADRAWARGHHQKAAELARQADRTERQADRHARQARQTRRR